MTENANNNVLIELTADIVSAYVSNNAVPVNDVSGLIGDIYKALEETSKPEAEEVVEDVPFAIIEEVPVFPGCKGTRAEKSKCLNAKIKKHVSRRFNGDLAGELGLSPGKKKIWVVFRIDPKGNITEINARAPHPRLKKEAIRVAKTLPKMIPGKQRGVPVGMKYTLPISFNVE